MPLLLEFVEKILAHKRDRKGGVEKAVAYFLKKLLYEKYRSEHFAAQNKPMQFHH